MTYLKCFIDSLISLGKTTRGKIGGGLVVSACSMHPLLAGGRNKIDVTNHNVSMIQLLGKHRAFVLFS